MRKMGNQVPENLRKEIKFVTYEIHYSLLVNWLRMHPAGFAKAFPDRWVNNIYFDNYGYGVYSENLSGISSRTKVRYRWYGQSNIPDVGTLEIKRKRNCFGWKYRFKIDKAPYEADANWRQIRHLISEQLPDEEQIWLNNNPLPVLYNHYLRKYFVSADGQIRVTFDLKQEVFDQGSNSKPNFIHRANLPGMVIVEFKFDRKAHNLASQIIQGIPIRMSRHSKYISGVKSIFGL